jgi:hypothetical protein
MQSYTALLGVTQAQFPPQLQGMGSIRQPLFNNASQLSGILSWFSDPAAFTALLRTDAFMT